MARKNTAKKSGGRKIDSSPILDRIASKAPPGSAIVLSGWLSPARKGAVRLHRGLSLEEYLEIDGDDILHQESRPGSGQATIWVKRSATVRAVRVISLDSDRSLREGSIAADACCSESPGAPVLGVLAPYVRPLAATSYSKSRRCC